MKHIVLLFFVLFLFTDCNNVNKGKEVIKIGATLDFTGPNAVYGIQVKEGIDLAVDFINDTLKYGNNVIEVDYLDSKSNSKEAINNANRFTSIDKKKFIIGEISSNATKSMIPVIESNNAFLFAPASSGSILADISNNFARNWPSDDIEAGYAAKFALNNFKSNNPIIIYVNSYYGIGLKDKFKNVYMQNGKQIMDTLSFEVDQTDFKSLISKVKEKNPDCIYLAGNPKEMGRFMKQLSEQNYRNNIVSNTGFLQTDCLGIAGIAANGVVVPTPKSSDLNLKLNSVKRFQKMFYNTYKKEPTLVNANSFDAIILIYDAIQKVGQDAIKVARDIRNKKGFEGASGISNFSDGEIELEIMYVRIENQKPVEITE